jgi:hypothetical protein
MRHAALVAGTLLLGIVLPPASRGQVGEGLPGEAKVRQTGSWDRYLWYGSPTPAPLREIVSGRFRRRAVRTRGVVSYADAMSGFLKLSDRGAEVLVIVVDELSAEVRSFVGLTVEVTGLPRELYQSQGTCLYLGQTVPQSICDDPLLPPTPDLGTTHPFWPRTSLTIWSIADVTPLSRRRRSEEEAFPTLRELLGGEAPSDGRVVVRGRFCGRNLCGGLSTPPPKGDAWVFEQDGAAVWVVGREAKGKGWWLDPLSPGDTSRWLEVVGRIETCGKQRCLRADSVTLVRTPAPAEPSRR